MDFVLAAGLIASKRENQRARAGSMAKDSTESQIVPVPISVNREAIFLQG